MNTIENQHIILPLKQKISHAEIQEITNALKEKFQFENNEIQVLDDKILIDAKFKRKYVQILRILKQFPLKFASQTKQYPVLGMTCASCASSSQNILNFQLGVVDAAVNYGNMQAQIEFIPELIQPPNLKQALIDGGYDLMIDESSKAQENLEEIQAKKHKILKFKTTIAIVLSIPLVYLGMFAMHLHTSNYWMWILATLILFGCGTQFYVGACKQLKNKTANMDTLVALSTGIAYIFSVFNTLFPEYWLSKGLEPHVYFESAGVVVAFILLGKLLEENAKSNTSNAIKKLIGLQPKTVNLILENDEIQTIPIENIQVGQKILVKPGEKIAADGKIIEGNSHIDESSISGEPIPVNKSINDSVFAGTINQNGSLKVEITKSNDETLLAQIIKMVQNAQGSKAPVQKLVDKIASIFVPIVLLISILSLIVWTIFGDKEGFSHGLMAMITVLVIACPCALGLATPTAIMVGIGKGAEKGILIKDAEALELAKKIDTVVLDKTGTITEGKPRVDQLKWFVSETEDLKNIIYSIENNSNHPLAEAIVEFIKNSHTQNLNLEVQTIVGKGLETIYNDIKFFIGNEKLIQEKNIRISNEIQQYLNEIFNQGKTISIFTNENEILAVISISDQIKPTSKKAIESLKKLNIETHMLTGDHQVSAQQIAQQVGIDQIEANVLPDQKLNYIQNLQNQGKTVAMVGDGINDSAALTQAHVGIAMGKGSDIAVEAAQMTILSNDLMKIPEAIQISKQTTQTIKQNLFWAFIYNVIGIPIAAGILYPINGFLLDPMFAGAAMALSSVSVVSNSLRLKYLK